MLDYKLEKVRALDFLKEFIDPDTGEQKYMNQLEEIANRERTVLEVDLDDVASYHDADTLLDGFENNTKRFVKVLCEAADDAMPVPDRQDLEEDIYDILYNQRRARLEALQAKGIETGNPNDNMPPELTRRYEVVVKPQTKQRALKLREINADHIGRLVTVQGIVTQVTDVKPLLTVATYLDKNEATEAYQEVSGRTYTPLEGPPKGSAGPQPELRMQTRGSKFVRFQEMKLQERAIEVPQGATPRSLVVHLRASLTRTCKPGDAVMVSGIFLPQPYTGFKAMRAGLLTTTFLEAMSVTQEKKSYAQTAEDATLRAQIDEISQSSDVYDRLAASLAPEIFGHEDVKKALLLCMVGGVTRQLPDGMKIRGDIHVCLMGDPGVAKSQLIKHIAHISPRAVYTTGKGSSGVGLTAAVQRDPVTGEMVLEGGALVLADKGICCIDEFDKMEESDRTAIHEVMEQQTVSIAKAGITTTLNTRTTLLAAANPAYGRYDPSRSPAENIALPAALLSRFDIMWLILDKADEIQDRRLASHVLSVHKEGRAPAPAEGPERLSPELLRAYIAAAKTYDPHFPRELTEYVAAVYAEMRQEEAQAQVPHSYTTARTLLSILRLSQALARLRFSQFVAQADVDEALRLMRMSKVSLLESGTRAEQRDPVSLVYEALRDDAQRSGKATYTWADLNTLLGHKFSAEQIRSAVEEYAEYNVFTLDHPQPGQPTVHIGGDDIAER
ncbi:DNA replication licensing factor MCM7 [Coccomyxa sp. Obi]|nr:DNA replication licensing factor MCM7 [Coccomyxa sp. Obi]